ncbi:MAG: hypothetical protein JSS10_00970 [Verrucomicrobia bacterium]|nr:hypothetical protein [Verrucomicrobiota bacterium]
MASAAHLPPSPWIRGSSIQPDSFWTACKYMYGRVFYPSQTPSRIEAYIQSHQGDAGLIGTDEHMYHSFHLKTVEGQKISLQPGDFHITFQGREIKLPLILRILEFVLKKIFFFVERKKPVEDPWILPSTLFNQAQENHIVQFRWKDTFYEYHLKQQTHPKVNCRENFEVILKVLQEHVELKARVGNPYLFEKDVPKEYCGELGKLFSNDAQIYSPANKTLSPLTPEKLNELIEHKAKAARFEVIINQHEEPVNVRFPAPGINLHHITLLVGHHYLGIFLYAKDEQAPPGRIIQNTRNAYTYRVLRFYNDIDPSTLTVELCDGIGCITFKAYARTASRTES